MRSTFALGSSLVLSAALGACATLAPEPDRPQDGAAELGPVARELARADQPPEVLGFFEGTFEALGVRVLGTDEAFTAYYTPAKVHLRSGIDEQADLVVELTRAELQALERFTDDGRIDEREAFSIMAAMFTPVTRQTLAHPTQRSQLLHQLLEVEDVIHVYLLDPDRRPAASHTLRYQGGSWIVREGIHDTPGRIFELTAADAREYQRRAMKARQKDTPGAWIEFAEWYAVWREGVSVPAPPSVSKR